MHVCCPISRIRWAKCSIAPADPDQHDGSFTKTADAIEKLLESRAHDGKPRASIPVQLSGMTVRRGAGMGSSTADVGAGLAAVNRHLRMELSAEELARFALAVEPTNGSLIPGIALFDHRAGKFVEELGSAPSLKVVTLDPGGFVDSLAYNRRLGARPPSTSAGQWTTAFELMREGVRTHDSAAVGRAASMSARAAVAIHDTELVAAVDRLRGEQGALGLCVSHSGTSVSLLFDGGERLATLVEAAHRLSALTDRCRVFIHDVVDGGPRYGAA